MSGRARTEFLPPTACKGPRRSAASRANVVRNPASSSDGASKVTAPRSMRAPPPALSRRLRTRDSPSSPASMSARTEARAGSGFSARALGMVRHHADELIDIPGRLDAPEPGVDSLDIRHDAPGAAPVLEPAERDILNCLLQAQASIEPLAGLVFHMDEIAGLAHTVLVGRLPCGRRQPLPRLASCK